MGGKPAGFNAALIDRLSRTPDKNVKFVTILPEARFSVPLSKNVRRMCIFLVL
jgi:hypothetical protein